VALAALAGLLGVAPTTEVAARSTSNFGPAVDTYCLAANGQTPYQDQGCALCHGSSLSQEVLPQWDWWRAGDFASFCPEVTNNPPDGSIVAPATDQIISAGDSLVFQGAGSDPDGDTDLRYQWDFAGAAPSSNLQNPGEIRFATDGDYTVSLTVSDSHGLADPSPAQRHISVLALQVCTDADGDGFSLEGQSCGLQDCDDQNGAIHPEAPELCSDGIDNNCNGLIDGNDPQALDCPVQQVCEDRDGDEFSPTGGFCGPLDCDDLDVTRNPGQDEICGDGLDNDCDGLIDLADAECNGGDCLSDLFETQHRLQIELARWSARRELLEIQGSAEPPDGSVTIRNAYSLEVIASAEVESDERWVYRDEDPSSVPCSVTVEYGQASETVDIQGAPVNCDAGDAGPGFELSITEIRWHDGEELQVSGRGAPSRANLQFVDADSDLSLGSTRARWDGSFRFEEELRRAPCAVLIQVEGEEFGPYSVKDAPCDSDRDDDEEDGDREYEDRRYDDRRYWRDDD
jgi:hypothetical protein